MAGEYGCGPWIFKRNGSTYVTTVHRSTALKGFTSHTSGKIVINQYLGEHSWPNCLHETHCLLYPQIELSRWGEIRSEMFQYLRLLPSNNDQQDSNNETVFLVTATNCGNRHVHHWQLHFDQLRIGSNRMVFNNNNNNFPISCGKIPDDVSLQLMGNLFFTSDLKITASPYRSNKYSIRIIEYWSDWWQYYESKEEFMNDDSDLEEDAYTNYVEEYNAPNILLWDYNIDLNTFEMKNKFSLMEWDGSPIQYSSLNVSNDGRYVLSSSDWGLGICRVDELKLGTTKVQNYKKKNELEYGGYGENFYISLSNDNKFATLYEQYRSNSFYLKSAEFYIQSNTLENTMERWLSTEKKLGHKPE